MTELVVFVGLQASGKSTFYEQRLAATHALVSKDLLRRGANRQRRMLARIEALLAAGTSVVVDNTSPARSDRAPLFALAKRFGLPVVGYYFQSRYDECARRNEGRPEAKRVPAVALGATSAALEIPSYAEPFSKLWYVAIVPESRLSQWEQSASSMVDDSLFSVEAWKDDDEP